MRFLSSRDSAHAVGFATAIQRPLAPDGGLYVPEQLPRFEPQAFGDCETLAQVAERLLAPFFEDSVLAASLPAIAAQALTITAPVLPCSDRCSEPRVLELYHGPTAAFKDFGARFLACCLERLEAAPRTILVATSGDTGSAVAAAFHGKPAVRVVVLYPAGGVSPRQEHLLSCWGDNIAAYRVAGSFDHCQALAKAAFADPQLARKFALASANSINLGRLLPQMSYYAAASLAVWRETDRPANFIVPTGNLGNGLACVWARALGLPIGRIVLATNANRTISDFLASDVWRPRPSIATLASAMDVGDPGNMERLRCFAGESAGAVAGQVSAAAVDDSMIRQEIAITWQTCGRRLCPHTATAMHVYRSRAAAERTDGPWVVVATAHPAKFERIVEPIVGGPVESPPALAELLARPAESRPLAPRLQSLARELGRPPVRG